MALTRRSHNSHDPASLTQLGQSISRALYTGETISSLTALLTALAEKADEGSEAWAYACTQLAEQIAASDPWRASLLVKRVIAAGPHRAEAYGVLGLAQSFLGNHRYAVTCYEAALEFAHADSTLQATPRFRVTLLHNLGHLYDVALDNPRKAIPPLSRAFRLAATDPSRKSRRRGAHAHHLWPCERGEITASLAHALVRAGFTRVATAVLRSAKLGERTRTQLDLARWLDERACLEP